MPEAATKREFCRRLFRAGGTSTTERHAFLDTLSDAALDAQAKGKALTGSSGSGTSVQFTLFSAFSPGDVLDLLDEARSWADAANVTTALALISPVRHVSSDFSGLACSGL